ncbi:MAG: Lrp/AsnC ligand binding domain-containing protein [Victivallaceae bacterium]|nr:Lrp/AsnC ligand binding domain-containing protein [Victivallaceae bacterium]
MVTGIVLVNVERPLLKKVIKNIMDLEGVTEVYAVAGEYDLVVMVRVKDNSQLAEIVANQMPHEIKGILHTKTLISLEAYSELDIDSFFNVK